MNRSSDTALAAHRRRMKRRIRAALAAILMMLAAEALAADSGLSHIPDDCGQTPCVCFIQRGDEGGAVREIALLLKARGYLEEGAPIRLFTEETEDAVKRFQADRGLPRTGALDDETLTWLLWDMSPARLDAALPVDPKDPATWPDMAYIPTDGGEKRHGDPECSGMLDPRKVSVRNAEKLGFIACEKCAKDR